MPMAREHARVVCHEMAPRLLENSLVRPMRLAAPRGARHLVLSAFAAVLTLGILAVPAAAAGGGAERPSQLEPPPLPAGVLPLGSVPSDQRVDFEVVLSPRDPAGLGTLLSSLYDPSSPGYHQWLAPGAFDQEFGPSPGTVDATLAWLRGLGLHATAGTGFTVDASGSASDVGAGLGVSLERYRLGGGRAVFAESATPQVPGQLAPDITTVVGLNDLPAADPNLVKAASGKITRAGTASAAPASGSQSPQAISVCSAASAAASQNGGYTPVSLGAAYGVPSLVNAGDNGFGERLAVYELAPSSSSDVAAYDSCVGVHVPLTVVNVDGGGTVDQGGTEEADLDIEQLATQAPGATSITSYEGPNTDMGAYDTAARIVSDDTAKFVSDSWGICEAGNPPIGTGSIASVDLVLEQAAAQGQSVFTAAGDSGSEDCYPVSNGLAVDYPSSSPWVTAVGGTSLSLNGTETVWNGCDGVADGSGCQAGSGAGGGGASGVDAKPVWQANLTSPPTASCGTNGSNCRELPDVSADAGVPVAFYTDGSWNLFLGTSIGAPLLAGIWADRGSECGQPASGDAAQVLYQLANSGAVGGGFNDITSGTNDFTGSNPGDYVAAPGYDLTSGLGSVIAGGVACTAARSVSPAQGPAGTVVTIHGFGLENAKISIDAVAVPVLSATGTSAQVVVPASSGVVSVTATGPVANGTNQATFTYGAPSGVFSRVFGATAIGTSIAASQASFPASGSANAVVLARSDFFSDALAGGPLAAVEGGPVLITPGAAQSASLDPSVEAEIQRVLVPGGTVFILGGNLALSPNIDATLQGLGYKTVRLAGTDLYQTAILIAQQIGNPKIIFEATALNFADALSAVPAAVLEHGAILLTDGSTQNSETAAYLAAYPSDTRYAIGGPLAAAGADPGATAVYGADLYATSAAVANQFFPNPTAVGAATGTAFPDALSAGPGLGRAKAPLLLVPPTGALPAAIAAYLNQVASGVSSGLLFGGPLAVADQVLAELDGAA
jgi:kumamolisin